MAKLLKDYWKCLEFYDEFVKFHSRYNGKWNYNGFITILQHMYWNSLKGFCLNIIYNSNNLYGIMLKWLKWWNR